MKKWQRYGMNDYWAIRHTNGALMMPAASRRACIQGFLDIWHKDSKWATWKYWRKEGTRCVKVRIIEVKK